MTRRSALLVLMASLALVALSAGAAQAHIASFPTQVSISYDGTNFVGQVSSNNPDCVPNRQVTLFERQVGGGAIAVGSDTTDSSGNYSIPQPGADGQFHVTVSARNLPGGYGHAHTCAGATSEMAPAGSGVLGGALERDGDVGAGVAGVGIPFTGTQWAVGVTVLAFILIAAGLVVVRRARSTS